MAWVRQAVALAHQARHVAQIKVRQPLSRLIVEQPQERMLRDSVVQLMKAELNVEAVEVVDTLEGLSDKRPAPNFRSLGPRLGPRAQVASEWIRRQSAFDLRERLAGGSVNVDVDGESLELEVEDVVYETVMPDHFAMAEEGGVRVALDTRLDPVLRTQGTVRELTHRLQLARKNAGFEVTDRIRVTFDADASLTALMAEYHEEIAEEVLAVSLAQGQPVVGEYTERITFDGLSVSVGMTRVTQ